MINHNIDYFENMANESKKAEKAEKTPKKNDASQFFFFVKKLKTMNFTV